MGKSPEVTCISGRKRDNIVKWTHEKVRTCSMYQKGWMYNMILPWLTGGIAALDLFIKDEIEREGEEEFPRDLPAQRADTPS